MKSKVLASITALSLGLSVLIPGGAVLANEKESVSPSTYISQSTNNDNSIMPLAQYGVITGNGVRLRATPSLSGKILATLNKGTEVVVSYDSPVKANGYTWKKISTLSGTVGWVAINYLKEYNE